MASSLVPIEKGLVSKIPKDPALISVFGPTRSGKTAFTTSLLFSPDGLAKRFEFIALLSPTAAKDKQWEPWVQLTFHQDEVTPEKIEEFVADVLEFQGEIQRENPKAQSLIIVDDCLGSVKPSSSLVKLCSRYRHYGLSMFWLSQQWRDFKPVTRTCSDFLVLFGTHNHKEKSKITDELSGAFPGFEGIYEEETSPRFGCLVVDQKERRLMRKNGAVLLAPNESQ